MHWSLFPLAAVPLLTQLGHSYEVKTPPLDTDWTYKVGTDPWPEYPRPQLRRDDWLSLNGIWKWRAASGLAEATSPPVDEDLIDDVLVPSCLESALSGVMVQDVTYAWFTRNFEVPEDWETTAGRILLNFEAVDYEATVYINGKEAGFHRGGYWRFTIDATDLIVSGNNTIHVFVFDPTDMGDYVIPLGKQTRSPSHIFYTPCTGIWQSVWLEAVPASYITQLDVAAGMDGKVTAKVWTGSNSSEAVKVEVIDNGGTVIATHEGSSNEEFTFTVDSPKLWSPNAPNLYNLTFTMGSDEVKSYTGFRTISVGEVQGIPRPLINGEFIFQFGPLDQGWFPDGLMTPPNREAMEYDLKFLKSQGINMLRKHIKVEPDLYYRACDELGILVIQDMVSLRTVTPNAEQQAEWERQIDLLINQHKSYPSIYTWVIYNEGWGQITSYYPEFDIAAHIKEMDPTRLIDATSGWNDHGAGDWHDNHHYATPQCGTPFYSILSTPYDNKRIAIQGEFGGIGHNISEEHAWKVQKSINEVNQTYELSTDLEAYNYRGHTLLRELREQIEKYSCSAAVWTQTTDVEGEVNGFMTYDRRLIRLDDQWKDDIQALYDAAASRGGASTTRR
ncbi:glycoside hydrolase superfamily [Microdochium trichocladiopsis]|uniref:Glycoside hydrolase superfamily n=1 Tax=Microdochium trichocladiopsis TaxID=1682393 RepID=A0A9P8Y8P1_9PEZI|nr:glycoside hydrolase superfamily [Microdochium trichocladiopsis]KAH7030735.1 glycoside hydrolase superfamily [Microdochium trichocladiopsis]